MVLVMLCCAALSGRQRTVQASSGSVSDARARMGKGVYYQESQGRGRWLHWWGGVVSLSTK